MELVNSVPPVSARWSWPWSRSPWAVQVHAAFPTSSPAGLHTSEAATAAELRQQDVRSERGSVVQSVYH